MNQVGGSLNPGGRLIFLPFAHLIASHKLSTGWKLTDHQFS